jgi:F-box/leucine-rich repeat protein 14
LKLSGCYKITDVGLKHVAALRQLITLNLDECNRITDAGLKHIAALGQLTTLKLYGCGRITDAGRKNFKELQHQNYQHSVFENLKQSNMLFPGK